MKTVKNRYGEDTPWYENAAERDAGIEAYLAHDYSRLTLAEIAFLRECDLDPDGSKFDAAHAGMLSEEVDQLDFDGIVIVHDLGRTLEEGRQILLDLIGPHPVTPFALYCAERRLSI